MSTLVFLGAVLALLFLSAVFSGSETGIYSLSRVRLQVEAREGRSSARLLGRLLRRETLLLITLLVGNNLMLEVLAHLVEHRAQTWGFLPAYARELAVAAVLTPVVFLFGELLPKDLFRLRPHMLLGAVARILWVTRALLLPLSWPLHALAVVWRRLLGLGGEEVARALGREEMLAVLAEGVGSGALAPHAGGLARNVLRLRQTLLLEVVIPLNRVQVVDFDQPAGVQCEVVGSSNFTRLPAWQTLDGVRRVVGYVHQLDVLRDPERTVESQVRKLPSFAPNLPVDRALARLRLSGQRLALVGPSEAPLGLVTLMDLLEVLARES